MAVTFLPMVQVQRFDSAAIVPRGTYVVGQYIVPIQPVGNSLLSSLIYKSGSGTLSVSYYQLTVFNEGEEKTELSRHTVLSSPNLQADQILSSRIHNRLFAEILITGGSVEFGVVATVVDQFASDLDASLRKEGQPFNLNADKGLITSSIDTQSDTIELLKSKKGVLRTTTALVPPFYSKIQKERISGTVDHLKYFDGETLVGILEVTYSNGSRENIVSTERIYEAS